MVIPDPPVIVRWTALVGELVIKGVEVGVRVTVRLGALDSKGSKSSGIVGDNDGDKDGDIEGGTTTDSELEGSLGRCDSLAVGLDDAADVTDSLQVSETVGDDVGEDDVEAPEESDDVLDTDTDRERETDTETVGVRERVGVFEAVPVCDPERDGVGSGEVVTLWDTLNDIEPEFEDPNDFDGEGDGEGESGALRMKNWSNTTPSWERKVPVSSFPLMSMRKEPPIWMPRLPEDIIAFAGWLRDRPPSTFPDDPVMTAIIPRLGVIPLGFMKGFVDVPVPLFTTIVAALNVDDLP
jgi:hypothetical protein